MANYTIYVTDQGNDQWTAEVRKDPTTAPAGGTVLTNGGATNSFIHYVAQHTFESVKDDISTNGHN